MTEEEHKILAKIAKYPHLLGHLVGLDKLTEQHSQWIHYCWNTNEHTSLQAHRGSFKTTSVTFLGPVWWLLFNPEETISISRKTHTEACDTLAAIMKIYQNPEIQALYHMAHGKIPVPTISRNNRVAFDFKTSVTKEGSIDVYGVESSMTGTHYGKMLLDDIVTLKDRLSKADRERTKQFLMEVLTNIINPGKQVCHLGTPWHKNDAWEISPQPILKFDVNSTGILTAEQIAEKKSRTTPSLWAANYDLVHQSDDRQLFSEPQFGEWQHSPMKAAAHLDAAFGGDCTSGFTIMRRTSTHIQAIGRCWTGHIKSHYIEIITMCQHYRVDTLYVETNADKGFVAEALRETARAMGYYLKVVEYAERQQKDIKIATNLQYHWKDLIWDSSTDGDYISQVTDWIEGQEPNDCPDSAASLLREHFGGPKGKDPMALYRL